MKDRDPKNEQQPNTPHTMNYRKTLEMKELLDLDDSVSEIEMQDLIRRVIPRSEVHFTDGVLRTSAEGVACLCDAIIAGRIKGNLRLAQKILQEVRPPQPEPEFWVSIAATRKICLAVIEGRGDGDPAKARKILEWLDKEYPHHR